MNLQQNNRGGNSLGMIGIVICIVLFEVLVGFFIYQITQDNITNIFVSNCDCSDSTLTKAGTLISNKLGCDLYLSQHGFNEMYNKCESQIVNNVALQDAVANRFMNLTIFAIIIFALNATLILIAIFVLRGVSD